MNINEALARRLIDNAATAAQVDFDAVTREAITLNVIDPLITSLLDACKRAEWWFSSHPEGAEMRDVMRAAITKAGSLPSRSEEG